MDKKEFLLIRHNLDKTQKQMAQLLGVSLRTVQSFEQGLRQIPIHIERQTLLLLALKRFKINKNKACWKIRECSLEDRRHCPAWELGAGQLCWLINGTFCEGKVQKNWSQKMEICRKCKVFPSGPSI